jgi:hypothetical protein
LDSVEDHWTLSEGHKELFVSPLTGRPGTPSQPGRIRLRNVGQSWLSISRINWPICLIASSDITIGAPVEER